MNELFDIPFIFLTTRSVQELTKEWGFEPSDEIEVLCAQVDDSCQLLKQLCSTPETYDHALTEMCSLLRPRVRIWWAYQCLEMVIEKVKDKERDFEVNGIAAEPGAEALKEVDELAELDEKEVLPPPVIVDGVNLSDPASYPEPHINDKGEFIFLPEPLQNNPYRAKTLLEEKVCKKHNARKDLPKSLANVAERFRKKKEEKFIATHGMSSEDFWMKVLKEHDDMAGKNAPKDELPLRKKLEERFARAREILKEQMGVLDKNIDEMKSKLPTPKVNASLSSDRVEQVMKLIMNWVVEPTTENGLAVFELAQKCNGDEGAVQMLAYATYWSCPDIAPAGSPVPVSPSPALSPKGVFGALTAARTCLVPDVMPDEFLEDFLKIGIEVAQGISLWDEQLALNEIDDPWRGKSGFGRKQARPDDMVDDTSSSPPPERPKPSSTSPGGKGKGFGKIRRNFTDGFDA